MYGKRWNHETNVHADFFHVKINSHPIIFESGLGLGEDSKCISPWTLYTLL